MAHRFCPAGGEASSMMMRAAVSPRAGVADTNLRVCLVGAGELGAGELGAGERGCTAVLGGVGSSAGSTK